MNFIDNMFSQRAGLDVISLLTLLTLCLLEPTNGLGSTGMLLAVLIVGYQHKQQALLWWQKMQPLFVVAILYFFVLALYTFNVVQGLHTVWSLIRSLLMSMLAIYILQIEDVKLKRTAYGAVFLMVLYGLCIFLYNVVNYGFLFTLKNEWLYSGVHRNRLGVGLALAYLLAISVVLSSSKSIVDIFKQKTPIILAAILGITSLVNASRGALLGMAVTSVVLVAVWHWQYAVLLVVLGMSAAYGLNHMGLLHLSHGSNSIANGREFLWPLIWNRFLENPWIGYGLHAVNNDPVLASQHIEEVSHTHNIYLDILYSSGFVGMAFWIVWTTYLIKIVRMNFVAKNNLSHYLGVALLSYTLIHGIVDFAFYSMSMLIMFVMAIVLMCAPKEQS